MSTQTGSINFSNLWDVTPEILDVASKENSSELLDYRLVSKPWYSLCETVLRALWVKLQNNPPMGAIDILSNIYRINKETPDTHSVVINFMELARLFKRLPMFSLPIRINEFQSLQIEYDIALQTIWPRLHNILAALPNLPNLPPVDAGASVIRPFLNDPNNSAALSAPIPVLDLSGLNLETVPPELERLSGLQALDLSNNQLSWVPNFNLPNLTWLDLSSNQLSWVPNFTRMPHLIRLFLYRNQLTKIPDFTHLSKLIVLALSRNKLAKIHDFAHLTNLEALTLTSNDLIEVPHFSHMQNLNLLSLTFNRLRKIHNFAHLPELTELHIGDNQLTEIPDFAHLLNLSSLFLHGNRLIVIPEAVLNRFPESDFAQLFISQLTYECQSPLASLYQTFLANKPLQEQIHAFDALDQKDKNLIFEMVWEAAGKPVTRDCQWGEHHAFDDGEMPRFRLAVQKAIFKKLNSLPSEKKNQVYGGIYHLAGQPLTEDSEWGEHHAEEHPARLADALARVNN